MKKRVLFWSVLALIVVVAVAVTWIVIYNNTLRTVDNDYLYTLEGRWDGAKDFSENMAAVKKDGKWGFIDCNGNVIVEPMYSSANSFSEGLAAVQNDGKWGYIDKTGKLVIPFTLDSTYAFSEGLAAYSKGNYYGYINTAGETVIEAIYSEASLFKNGVACVKKENRYGYIRPDGTAVTEFIYGSNTLPKDGLIPVFYGDSTQGINTGYIDVTGRQILDFDWYDAKHFSEGLAVACHKYTKPYGFIDNSGVFVIQPEWDSAESFVGGVALVQKDLAYTYINKSGEKITDKTYEKAYSFTQSGLARVGYSTAGGWKFGYIDATGEEVIAPQYADAHDFEIGIAAVSNGKKWGFIRSDGTVLSNMKWTDVGDFTSDGIAMVKSGDVYGFVKLK